MKRWAVVLMLALCAACGAAGEMALQLVAPGGVQLAQRVGGQHFVCGQRTQANSCRNHPDPPEGVRIGGSIVNRQHYDHR